MDIYRGLPDYETFLAFMTHAMASNGVAVHAFALMTNHFHFIATPTDPDSIPLAMKELGERYTRYYNRKYQRIGTPWSGRYMGKPIDDGRYWLTCLRYVEENPVRAGLVSGPDSYRWSSYSAHAWGAWPEWLTPHPVYLALGRSADERQLAYREFFNSPASELPLPQPAGSDYV
jgi:putative transposase